MESALFGCGEWDGRRGGGREIDGACPLCEGGPLSSCLRIPNLPVHVGALWPTQEAAVGCPKGELDLFVCHRCGFVGNRAFDPILLDYEARYDNALHHSPFFRRYEQKLAARLVDRYGVRGRHVIEIGCGNGHFIGLLCALGGNRGVGFDPSHEPEHADPLVGDAVRVIRGYYGEAYADLPVDLLVCRHVLEHLPKPRAFLSSLHSILSCHPGTVLYFEVPNVLLALRGLSIWNLIYEHPCNYTTPSLARLFASSGFEILDAREAYERQFASVECRYSEAACAEEPPVHHVAEVIRLAAALRGYFRAERERWLRRLEALATEGRRAVVWGAGAKGASFLNVLGPQGAVECVVDVNPRKQGHFLPGIGLPIVAPASLREQHPDLVIVMNPIYEPEVRAELTRLGITTRVESV